MELCDHSGAASWLVGTITGVTPSITSNLLGRRTFVVVNKKRVVTWKGYFANGIGKGKQICKNELEKIKFNEIKCSDALVEVVRILDLCHAEWKDKPYEIDLSWVSDETNHIVKKLTKEQKQQIIDKARANKMQE